MSQRWRCSSTNTDENEELVATQEMCHYCFDVLMERILRGSANGVDVLSERRLQAEQHKDENNRSRRSEELIPQLNISPSLECPLFVTWEKRRFNATPPALSPISSGFTTPASSNIASDDDNFNQDNFEYDLRGCIGTLAPRQLNKALSEFALLSAFKDRRFNPISLHELRELRVGVSLLVKYEECKNCFDWKVGTHGIIIKFEISRRGSSYGEQYSATYLPEVAYEQRWNPEDTVISLIRKAGYRGYISDELLEQIQCTRYQSSKYRTTYQDYVMSKWHGEDPLSSADAVTVAAVDEALRQKVKAGKTCVVL
ncbi:hypothetical protein ACHAWO_000137 [Cyclotella atomus]|jgi:uncharacterized protein (TIGR00296 family)|uniref:AMMECR1 domain-containing protein n=1 Tax=Cyclotella atomus TaxID=382360 RepID=A0ABD3PSM5_9STRA